MMGTGAATYLYFSNILDTADLTVSSAQTNFPAGNLQDRDPKSLCKPNATETFLVTADAGEDATASNIIVVNHNAYTQGITGLYVQIDDNDGFSSPTSILGSPGSPHAPVSGDEPFWNELFTGVDPEKTERYWRAGFVGATSSLSIGDIYLTKRIQILDINDDWRHPGGPWGYSTRIRGSLTKAQAFKAAVTYGENEDIRQIEFKSILESIVDDILDAEKTIIRGIWLPWFYSDERGYLHLVRLAGPIKASHQFGPYWDLAMEVEEEGF